MSDDSATTIGVTRPNEKLAAAPEWSHLNGNGAVSIGERLDHGRTGGLSSSPRFLLKKEKRTHDSALEIVCGWVVEHQIGISSLEQDKAPKKSRIAANLKIQVSQSIS